MSVLGLVVLGFFWVSGGIYGNEELLQAAPVPYIFALCVVAPLVYSLPLAFMCTEMASAMPVDGASVVFVQEAFGDEWGAHNALWCWLISVVDAAVYPAMAASYIDKGAFGGALDDGSKQAILVLAKLERRFPFGSKNHFRDLPGEEFYIGRRVRISQGEFRVSMGDSIQGRTQVFRMCGSARTPTRPRRSRRQSSSQELATRIGSPASAGLTTLWT